MRLEFSPKQFRRLLDMVYIGNWILNSTRSEDRIVDYDEVESLVFGLCEKEGLTALYEHMGENIIPSRAFAEGGIHEAIMDYEDTVFFEILAEELARRDMQEASVDQDDVEELNERITAYIAEFERNGTDNISLNL
ncbi:MAG: hypothetical protein LBK75_05960 [Oscillospiraceae bacterium]|jgi:hypothetical protein|nr:hypothetical protein [Oscillospiraceae bacterium]